MEKQEIRTFGRRHGKKLSVRQNTLIETILPTIKPDILPENTGIILEIGFGAGEHLRDLCRQMPDKIIIGAEPYINGVASCLSAITDTNNAIRNEYKNMRIFPDDVRNLLRDINYRFSQIWVLHPDPWPKARHEKRRLLHADFIKLLASRLESDGEIIIGTDHWDYYNWIKDQASTTRLTVYTPDLNTINTRYQKKTWRAQWHQNI